MGINTTHPDLEEYQRQCTAANAMLRRAAGQSDADAVVTSAQAQVHATLALAAATAATVPPEHH